MLARGGIFNGGINSSVLAVSGNEKCIFIITASWCLGAFFETAAKRIESGKGRWFNIRGERWAGHRKTAFLECIAVSAYMKCYKF